MVEKRRFFIIATDVYFYLLPGFCSNPHKLYISGQELYLHRFLLE